MASIVPIKPTASPLDATVPVDDEYIDSFDELWLAMAATVARKSKDPRCRVGAVITHSGLIVSAGYNGLARDVYDDPSILDSVEEKLRVIVHAEQNAIYNAARRGVILEGASIFVTKFPCLRCCNAIIQAGIKRIYTHDDRFWGDDPDDADHSRKKSLLRQAGIDVVAPYHPDYMPKRVVKKRAAPAAQQLEVELPLGAPESQNHNALTRTDPPSARVEPTAEQAMEMAGKKSRRQPPKARTKKESSVEQLSVFPARTPIPGGKS